MNTTCCTKGPTAEQRDAAKLVEMLVLDVDGVMTDGSIQLDDHGVETKRFFVRDGQGITAWIKLGFHVAIITRRGGNVTIGSTGRGECIMHRCRELGIAEHRVIRGASDKSVAVDQLLGETGLEARQLAFVGDDWPDIKAMKRVGFPVAVADAGPHVKAHAAYITSKPGGHGAVRETIELLIDAKGMMEKTVGMYA